MINITTEGREIEEDLKLYHKGVHACPKGYSFGPFIRDHYLVHFIIEGKGKLEVLNKTYHLEKNQAFFIFPNETTYYEADAQNPWTYCWLGFHGDRITSIFESCTPAISSSNPVIEVSYKIWDIINEIVSNEKDTFVENLKNTSLLYLFLYQLCCQNSIFENRNSPKLTYVYEAINYIKNNYSMNLTVQGIADYICINRSYFSRIFKEITGTTPIKYIINLRMEKADSLLKSTCLPIASVGLSVGYTDQYQFSKIFKITKGVYPSKVRSGIKVQEKE